MSELLAAPAIVFRGREEGYKAAVIKSRFLLYANGVAIQNPSNERCGSRGQEITRFQDRPKLRVLLIRSFELCVRKCVCVCVRARSEGEEYFIREL